ncbi:cell adhesion molecule 3-like [Amphiura filiformis]|uniref:cell adhesion molecule 3-like n=1 Tax=Amphiura filiformis TaxID=82378 RepID=UPI003B2230F9
MQKLTVFVTTVILSYYGCQSQDLIGPSPANQGVLRGGSHTLTCSKSSAVENQLLWEDDTDGRAILIFLGTTKISAEPKYNNFEVISGNAEELNLAITAAEVEDGGVYNCKLAGSPISGQGVTLQIEVVGSPLQMTPMNGGKVTVTEGETSSIVCTATGYRPVVTIKWYHKMSGGQEIQITEGLSQIDSVNPSDGDTSDVVGTLEYTANKAFNDGEVKCVATGLHAEIDKPQTTAILDVQFCPTTNAVITGCPSAPVSPARAVTLSCQSAVSNPALRLDWYANNVAQSQTGASTTQVGIIIVGFLCLVWVGRCCYY